MEHYRSVFANTAVMVIGLVASSPLMRAQDGPAAQIRATANLVDRSEGSVWKDPPRVDRQTASPVEAEASSVPKPASFTLLTPEMAALLMAGDMKTRSDRAESAQALRRHRPMKVARRDRQPALAGAAGAERTASRPQQDARIDSIGDLVRACLDTTTDCSKSARVRPSNAPDGVEGSIEMTGTTSNAS